MTAEEAPFSRRQVLTGAFAMGLLEILRARPAHATTLDTPAPKPLKTPRASFAAQLVGANAISAMFDPGYGVENYLAGLLERSPDGMPPKAFRSITGADGVFREGGRVRFDRAYLVNLALSFQFVVTYYGQTVEGFNMFMWNGVRMNGLPVVSGFSAEHTEEEARNIWMNKAYLAFGLTSKPSLTIASGKSGWSTLEAGYQRIDRPEGKVIWEVSVDIPSYPKDDQPNEGTVLLMLAHPDYDTGRKPLAYLSEVAVVAARDAKPAAGETARVASMREAVQQACSGTGLDPATLRSFATDCGRGTREAGNRLSDVGAALHGIAPQLDVVQHRIDMAALLGELGANTVNWTLLVAAYAAHTRNEPVLYLSAVDPDAARAMIVVPPADHTPPDPDRTFREHRQRGQWNAPWWGQRLDGKKDY